MTFRRKMQEGHWPVYMISMISAFSNLFLPIVIVRILDPIDIGIYKIFFLYAQSIAFLSLAGAPLYSIYFWIGQKDAGLRYIEHAWLISFLLGLIASVTGLFFIKPLAQFVHLSQTQTLLLLFSAITSAPASFYGEYLIASGKKISGGLFNSGFEIMKCIVIITLVYYTRHIDAAFYGFTLLFLIKLFLAFLLGRKNKIITLTFDKDKTLTVLKYCAPLSLAGALGFFCEKIDMILLSSILSAENFAFYSMGCLSIPPLYILEMSVQKILIPALSESYYQSDKKTMIHHYRKAQNDIAYLIIPGVFGLIMFNRPIIQILFTDKYIESANYLQFFALTYLAYIIPHDSIPRSTGHTRWILKVYLILTPLSIISGYLSAKQWGAHGALTSAIIFLFLPKIPGLIYSAELTGAKIRNLVAWKSIFLYVSINLILSLFTLLIKFFFESELNWFLVVAPLYAILYLFAIHLIRSHRVQHE